MTLLCVVAMRTDLGRTLKEASTIASQRLAKSGLEVQGSTSLTQIQKNSVLSLGARALHPFFVHFSALDVWACASCLQDEEEEKNNFKIDAASRYLLCKNPFAAVEQNSSRRPPAFFLCRTSASLAQKARRIQSWCSCFLFFSFFCARRWIQPLLRTHTLSLSLLLSILLHPSPPNFFLSLHITGFFGVVLSRSSSSITTTTTATSHPPPI